MATELESRGIHYEPVIVEIVSTVINSYALSSYFLFHVTKINFVSTTKPG